MNIVTKSGTNDLRAAAGSRLFRDKALNAQTLTEKSNVDKQDYRRYQFGGSFGGPIVQNKAHFFGAYERTQQDTKQAVNTLGAVPSTGRHLRRPSGDPVHRQGDGRRQRHSLAVRYGRNTNSQPSGAGLEPAPIIVGDSDNTFNSINVNHNWVLGESKLNEFVFQYANFVNHIPATASGRT